MGACNLDHSLEDVRKKLERQKLFLPEALFAKIEHVLQTEQPQPLLNELFHVLKKYDLVDAAEQEVRNAKIKELLS